MVPFEVAMCKSLQKLAQDIIPSDEDLKKQNKCADQIIKLLQSKRKRKTDIDRVCIAGSAGKKTTIIGSDNDIVLFINDEMPPFEDVLDEFEDILEMSVSYNIRNVRKTKFSVQFTASNFEFDVLPAANFTNGLQGDNTIDIQQQRVLKHIKKDPKKYCYMYSSSLAEASIRFMKQQDGFINEMVRIAKFWYKTLHFNDIYVSGAKNCIELIAVYAANQEQGMEMQSYLRSFHRFINYLENFDNLNIHFEKMEHKVLDKDRPRVMDPVNPYNNLAKEWDPKSIQLVKRYANETNQRLQILADSRMARLDQLFEPQQDTEDGTLRQDMVDIFGSKPTKAQWLVGTKTFTLLPDLKIRNERFHTDKRLWNRLETLKNYFQYAIHVSRASGYDESQTKVVIVNTINKQVFNNQSIWTPTTCENHDDFDITFTIPVTHQTALCISYRM